MHGDIIYETSTKTYQDQKRVCRQCGGTYTWEAGEVRYFTDKGLAPPSHCPECRRQRKAALPRGDMIPASGQHHDSFDVTGRWRDLYPRGNGGR